MSDNQSEIIMARSSHDEYWIIFFFYTESFIDNSYKFMV